MTNEQKMYIFKAHSAQIICPTYKQILGATNGSFRKRILLLHVLFLKPEMQYNEQTKLFKNITFFYIVAQFNIKSVL